MEWGVARSGGTNAIACDRIDYRDRGKPVLLIANAPGDGDDAIAAAGGRLLHRVAWTDAPATLSRLAALPVLVIETTGVATATLDAVLPEVDAYLTDNGARAVIALDEDQIDAVTHHLLGSHITLLSAPTMEQRIAALRAAADRPVPTLHDPRQAPLSDSNPIEGWVEEPRTPYDTPPPDAAHERLRTLEDGMTEIDRIVANLRRTVFTGSDVADRRPGYEAEAAPPTHPLRAQDVRRMIALRRLRGKFFGHFSGEMLFEDPAWDMLLDLFAAELENTRVSVSSLCIAAGVAPTTALRWIAKMTEMELFVRDPDPVDRRRAFMTLSPRASEAMRGYMHAARKMQSRG